MAWAFGQNLVDGHERSLIRILSEHAIDYMQSIIGLGRLLESLLETKAPIMLISRVSLGALPAGCNA